MNYYGIFNNARLICFNKSNVIDQSVCGSCWSFGTTGAIEGAYFVKTGQLIRLSQQVNRQNFTFKYYPRIPRPPPYSYVGY